MPVIANHLFFGMVAARAGRWAWRTGREAPALRVGLRVVCPSGSYGQFSSDNRPQAIHEVYGGYLSQSATQHKKKGVR